jgi:hypothetical protein
MQSGRLFKTKQGFNRRKLANPLFIYALKIDFPDAEPIKLTLPRTMPKLLGKLTEMFELTRPATCV